MAEHTNPSLRVEAQKHKPVDLPMKILETIVSTQKGWVIRQALKGAAAASSIVSAWLLAKGYSADQTLAISAGISALAAGGAEIALSFVASKIAAK